MKPTKMEWNSPTLGQKAIVEVYGTGGTPILHFDGYPAHSTLKERNEVLSGIKMQIDYEFNNVYCPIMSKDADILNKNSDPAARLVSYNFFEGFVLDELLPRIRKDSGKDFVILSGVGGGAFYALNIMLKHPEKFNKLIAICGPVNLRPYFGDFFNDSLYYNNPYEFIPNLNDQEILNAIRSSDLRLISSVFDDNKDQMVFLSDELSFKNIDHLLDVWGDDRDNTPATWAEMFEKHVP